MQEPPQHLSGKLGRNMIYAAWILLLALLTLIFNNYLDRQNNPNRNVAYKKNTAGVAEVKLKQNRYGHYLADGYINGKRVSFLLDTGATLVSVPESVARTLNLSRGSPFLVRTANGTITTYSTTLSSISLGAIELKNVRAAITPGMQGKEILLGMSFMKHLELIQRGNQLILRDYGSDTNADGSTTRKSIQSWLLEKL